VIAPGDFSADVGLEAPRRASATTRRAWSWMRAKWSAPPERLGFLDIVPRFRRPGLDQPEAGRHLSLPIGGRAGAVVAGSDRLARQARSRSPSRVAARPSTHFSCGGQLRCEAYSRACPKRPEVR